MLLRPTLIRRPVAFFVASFLVMLAGWVTMAPASSADSVTVTIGDYSYSVDDDDVAAGATVTAYGGAGGAISIPSSVTIGGTSYAVTTIGNSAFASDHVNSLVIPDSVLTIGDSAFRANQIASLDLGESVTTIGNFSFQDNQLSTVVIPDSVATVGSFAFNRNQISSLDLGVSVTTIGAVAFAENQLSTVVIPDSVITMDDGAFARNQISSLDLGASIIGLGFDSFHSNQISTLTIPASMLVIGNGSFLENPLTVVTFLGPAPEITTNVFGTPDGKTLVYPGQYASEDPVTGYTTPTWFGYTTQAAPTSTAPTIAGPGTATGTAGAAFSYTPSVEGSPAPVVDVRPNANHPDQLPDGLVLDSSTGEITGTPAIGSDGVYEVRLRARNSAGADALNVTITINKPDVAGLDPSISGVAQQGQTLTASAGPVNPADSALSYQWSADGSPIPGATGPTFTVTKAYVGQQITVTITATHPGYNPSSETSDPTVPVHKKYKRAVLDLSQSSAERGETVTLDGFGFHAGNTYTVRYNASIFGTGGMVVATVVADQYGELHVPVTIPNSSPSGPVTVTISGSDPALVISTLTITNG